MANGTRRGIDWHPETITADTTAVFHTLRDRSLLYAIYLAGSTNH
jgi:hypothetical protein